jgi:hypothetical protein
MRLQLVWYLFRFVLFSRRTAEGSSVVPLEDKVMYPLAARSSIHPEEEAVTPSFDTDSLPVSPSSKALLESVKNW